MNIQDAVKTALSTHGKIARDANPRYRFLPTNTADCMIVFDVLTGQRVGKRWNPNAEDLAADDWFVALPAPSPGIPSACELSWTVEEED